MLPSFQASTEKTLLSEMGALTSPPTGGSQMQGPQDSYGHQAVTQKAAQGL